MLILTSCTSVDVTCKPVLLGVARGVATAQPSWRQPARLHSGGREEHSIYAQHIWFRGTRPDVKDHLVCFWESSEMLPMMQWWCMMQVCFKMHDAEWHEQRQQRFLMSTRLLMRVLMPLMHWSIKFQSLDWILEPVLLIFSRPAMFLGFVARCFGYWDARKLWVDSHDFTLCSLFFWSQTRNLNVIFTVFSIIYSILFIFVSCTFIFDISYYSTSLQS